MKLRRLLRYPRTLGLLVLLLIAAFITQSRLPDEIDRAWVPHPINVVPLPDPLYRDGPFSGAWPGDLQHYDGRWLMGDGRGGIWHSRDGMLWQRASLVEHGRPRRMQNAPVRSINRGDNGTYMAAYLGGGGLAWPRVQRALGMEARRRAPIARSTDGVRWEVRPLPESCGIHFTATDGEGTWIAQGCDSRLLVSADDGRSWSVRETGLPAPLNAHAHQEGRWVVGAGRGSEGAIYYSTDLARWHKAIDLPTGVLPKRTLRLNGRLVMTGTRRFIASSTDGATWNTRYLEPGTGVTMRAGVWHPSVGYILVGSRGQAMYSPDLVTWSCSTVGLGTQLTGMAIAPTGDVLVSGLPAMLYRLIPERLTERPCATP